ncbi:retrovirus-related pol polyprotein from transposon TNT 1-94 [Tanacetum coccineum]
MSNSNTNLQTQSLNALHNAIMEAGSKDHPPMLAPVIIPVAEGFLKTLQRVDACPNACEMWKAIERLKQGESINVQDLETNLYWEFGKFISRDGESLESYYSRVYKITNELVRNYLPRNRGKAIVTSSAPTYDPEPATVTEDEEMSKEKEIDKLMALISLSENVGTPVVQKSGIQCYNCKEYGHVSRECQKPKRVKDAAYHKEKMFLCKQEEAEVQLNAEQADWKDDTDDESLRSGIGSTLYEHGTDSRGYSDPDENSGPNLKMEQCIIFSQSQLETQKTQFLNEIDRLSREYYYADHMKAILGVYTDLDEFTSLQCDYVETWGKCEHLEKELSKSRTMSKSFEALQKHAISLDLDLQQCKEKIKNDKSFKENQSHVFLKEREHYFEIQDLKAQLQDKGIAISELKKLIEKMKGKYVETKFEKSSVIRQPNAFKSQRQSILGKPAIFSNSLTKKDFSNSKPVTTQNVSNDFSKPVTAHILPQNMLSIVKNINVIAPGMYKVHTKPNQTRTPQLHQDIRKPNKRMSFSTGVIPTTSISRPQPKRNQLEDRVMSNNSQGKEQKVEDNHRNFKFSNNKTSNDNHDLCVLHYINGVNSRTKQPMAVPISTREPKQIVIQSVATSCKKTVTTDSTIKKSKNITRKLYEQVSKTCSWWYPKYTPPGYNWKPKSQIGNVNPNISMPLGNASRTANILEHKTPRFRSALSKSTCYIRDLKGNDLLTGSRGTYLYSITLQDSTTPILIFLMAKATSSQAWLWHHPSVFFCELGKQKEVFSTKTTPRGSKRLLQLLHMDLCGPMRVESINGKKYVLVIVDDYSRYTWTHFLRSKDETPGVLIDFLTLVQRGLHAQATTVQTNKGTSFLNKTLHSYFAKEGIRHETSTARTPEQNDVVERRNRTLVEAARTMLSASFVLLG